MRARLISADGVPPIELLKDITLIGRNEDCDVRLDHKSVSKLHCIIVKSDGLLLIRDLGSTNGTRVNGQRVRRASLTPNDALAIANLKYEIRVGADPDPDVDGGPTQLDVRDDESLKMRRNALPDVYPEAPAAPG
jgi:pSer/pThr/pTyr-binding forkhead associated (FHA) protein